MKFLGGGGGIYVMPEKVIAPLGDKQIIIETGKLAKQADGAVTVQLGETIVVVAAVAAIKAKPTFLGPARAGRSASGVSRASLLPTRRTSRWPIATWTWSMSETRPTW